MDHSFPNHSHITITIDVNFLLKSGSVNYSKNESM